MFTENESRRESSSHVRILAAAMFGLTFGAGYAIATHVEGANSSNVAIPEIAQAAQEPATVYFPSQYVNQAKEIEQHIEAF